MVGRTIYTMHKNVVEKIQKETKQCIKTNKTNIGTFYTRVENLTNVTFPNDERLKA